VYRTGLNVAWKKGVGSGEVDSDDAESAGLGNVSWGYTFTVVEPSELLDQMNLARCLGTFQSFDSVSR
jgi:hypothetical protein